MRDCCPANQFDHGCEGGSCQSATVPIIKILDRPPVSTPTFRDFIAIFAFITSMAVIGFTITELHQQEQQLTIQARV